MLMIVLSKYRVIRKKHSILMKVFSIKKEKKKIKSKGFENICKGQ
ncbi:MAG: hypothetical protein ACRCVJ_06290 [Clostridium sp.]